jgi:hypothetical protein
MALKAPDSVTADVTLTLPDGAGSSGQVLKTDGNGALSWTNASQSLASADQTLTGNRTIVMGDKTLTITGEGSKLKLPEQSIGQNELAKKAVTSDKLSDKLLITSTKTTTATATATATATDKNIFTALNIMKRLPFGARIKIGDIGDIGACSSDSNLGIENKVETAWKINTAAPCTKEDGSTQITISIKNADKYPNSGDLEKYTVSFAYEATDETNAEKVEDLRVPVIYSRGKNEFKISIEEIYDHRQEAYLNVMIFPAND